MNKIRVLIVEDSLTVRNYLCDVLSASTEFETVGVAATGREAIDLCTDLRPDVITMDIMLPDLNGLQATEHIMAHVPTPILVVSSSLNRGEVFKTYDALAAGAVDVIDKPDGVRDDGAWERSFLSRLRIVSRVRVITHPRARLRRTPAAPGPPTHVKRGNGAVELLVIGASTGGPSAIVEVLRGLPRDFDVPVLIVLHLGVLFAPHFCDWLTVQTGLPLGYATGSEPLSTLKGQVRLAPPERHMILRAGRVQLTNDPERHSCRPSVDSLFDSVADHGGAGVLACLLTGMGRDGAAGLLRLRRAGATTVAQDEATSVVFGMPREAIELGAAEHVLSISRIAALLPSWLGRGS